MVNNNILAQTGFGNLSDHEIARTEEIKPSNILIRGSYNQNLEELVELPLPDFICFDVDGVLANSVDFQEHTVQLFLTNYGFFYPTELLRKLKDTGYDLWDFAIEKARTTDRGDGLKSEEFRNELFRIERNDLNEERNTLVVDYDALSFINSKIPTIGLTNRWKEDLDDFMRQNRLDRAVSGVFGRESDINKKPAADLLVKACKEVAELQEAIKLATSEKRAPCCYMIGDSVTDLQPFADNAARVGIKVIPIAILPPGHGYNLNLEYTLAKRACAVYPSANHLFKDIALNFHPDFYGLIKMSLSEYARFREPKPANETAHFCNLTQGLNLTADQAYRTTQKGVIVPIDFAEDLRSVREAITSRGFKMSH